MNKPTENDTKMDGSPRCSVATSSLSPELQRLVASAEGFIYNVKTHKVAGWGDCEPQFDASFKELESAVRSVKENAKMSHAEERK